MYGDEDEVEDVVERIEEPEGGDDRSPPPPAPTPPCPETVGGEGRNVDVVGVDMGK